ncbi:MAG: [FeFe] hydrogenase, group A [Spirochaetia bacterium]|jgi:ferredoxin hydrogenase large subunit|nr:[FeFe] hydrogenase, group A [Spirochaetia bacterium]
MSINRRDFLKIAGAAAAGSVITGALTSCKKPDVEAESVFYSTQKPDLSKYDKYYFVQVNADKCQKCGTCRKHCPTGIINGSETEPYKVLDNAGCVFCGQCLINCPYGAIDEKVSFIDEIFKAAKDADKVVVAMPAPSVRYSLGEPFGMKPGTHVGGKMDAALRKLGFDIIWDNQFGADLTIMEEGTELIGRITKNENPLPQFTSCCPAWVKFVESFYPELIPNLSTSKSPIGMIAPMAKTYGAANRKVDPAKMYTVGIFPCIAKKFECMRPEMNSSGFQDTDASIDTRELAYMIKKRGIDFLSLNDERPDSLLGESTGAGTIFGVNGGVMEAALRFAYEAVSGQKLNAVDFTAVRGMDGVRSASVKIPNGPEVKVCVIAGLKNAKPVIDEVKAGKSPYHFIEVMTCPGGCVNGGGQPLDPEDRLVENFFGKNPLAGS